MLWVSLAWAAPSGSETPDGNPKGTSGTISNDSHFLTPRPLSSGNSPGLHPQGWMGAGVRSPPFPQEAAKGPK